MKAMSFALMLTLATAVTAVAEGEKYVSKEGRFAIAFPKDSEARNRKNEKGRMSLNAVLVESQGTSYGVAYCDVPEAELKNLNSFFDSIEVGLVRSSGAKVIERKEVAFGPDKLPSRNLLSEKDEARGRLVMVVKGTRIYAIFIRGSKEFIGSKEAAAFFDSFEFK